MHQRYTTGIVGWSTHATAAEAARRKPRTKAEPAQGRPAPRFEPGMKRREPTSLRGEPRWVAQRPTNAHSAEAFAPRRWLLLKALTRKAARREGDTRGRLCAFTYRPSARPGRGSPPLPNERDHS